MAQAPHKVLIDQAGTDGAYKYGLFGVRPKDAVVTARLENAQGRFYVSDAPYTGPAVKCTGTRTRGGACNADARPGETFCAAHAER